jgi:hypothetical protein
MRTWLILLAACSAKPAPVQAPMLKADLVDASTAMPGSAADESHASEPRRLATASTTGVVEGTVRDSKTHMVLPGVSIVVTAPTLAQVQTAITDDKGRYRVDGVNEDTCLVTAYYSDVTVVQHDVVVRAGYATTVDLLIVY